MEAELRSRNNPMIEQNPAGAIEPGPLAWQTPGKRAMAATIRPKRRSRSTVPELIEERGDMRASRIPAASTCHGPCVPQPGPQGRLGVAGDLGRHALFPPVPWRTGRALLERQPSRSLTPSGCGAVARLTHEHAIQPTGNSVQRSIPAHSGEYPVTADTTNLRGVALPCLMPPSDEEP